MTTGRINQVTIVHAEPPPTRKPAAPPHSLADRSLAERVLNVIETSDGVGTSPNTAISCGAPPRAPGPGGPRTPGNDAFSRGSSVRVPPGPVQRSERGLPPPRRGTSSSPRRPKALSAGRPAAPTLPDRPSKPQCALGRRAAGPYQLAAGYYACTTCIGTSSSSAAAHPSAGEGAAHRARSSRSARSL